MTRPAQHLITAVLAVLISSIAMDSCAETIAVKPAAIYLSLSAADLASTDWAIRNGAQEGNGFMASDRIAKQAAMASAFLAADVLLQRKGKRQEAKALRVIYAVVRVTAVAVNIHNAKRGAR